MVHQHENAHARAPVSRHFTWVLCAFIAIAAFFLITEHRAHLYGLFPYVLILACPVMHLVMHRKHGGGDPLDHRLEHDARAGSKDEPGAR